MCIICNAGEDALEAHVYLHEHDMARRAMKKAAAAMLAVSKSAPDAADRKRYDRTHKKLVRILRDWNSIEHGRERGGTAHPREGST